MPYHRKTAPKVIAGRVQRQNRDHRDHDYTETHQIKIERFAPDPGYRHLVSPADVSAFLALLPDWHDLSIGLHRVVLSAATDCDGWCTMHSVAICAWEAGLERIHGREYYDEHAALLRRMRVPCRAVVQPTNPTCPHCHAEFGEFDWEQCRTCHGSLCEAYVDAEPEAKDVRYHLAFTEATAQAFLLVHVLVHELGHHHDRMTSRKRRDWPRGESYAEEYARRHEDRLWPAYCRVFRPHEGRRGR